MVTGRIKRRAAEAALARAVEPTAAAACTLCGRPLGRRVEWHHPVPKSRGGRDTVPLHPICHRTIHAALSNHELERLGGDMAALATVPEVAHFLRWLAGKDPDFNAPTRRSGERRSAARDRRH